MARAVQDITKRSVAINLSLPLELLARMDEAAALSGVSRSEFLRNLVQAALEDLDDVTVATERLADGTDDWKSLDDLKALTKP